MSDDFQYYIDGYTSASHPMQVSLFKTNGNALVKVLEDNEAFMKTAEEYGFASKEFFSFKTDDGTLLNGFLIKPKNFDASRLYPVLVYQYSGPGSQNVSNSWGGAHFF